MGKLACIGALVLMGACHGKETDEVIAGLRADNQDLRAEIALARAENVALVAAEAGPSWPATASLKRVGGVSGRILYQRACPLGEALKGFLARTGTVVDALVPVCSPLRRMAGADGARTLERELAIIGGRGGRASDTLCPGERHLIGVRGRAAEVIDALQPVCEEARSGPRIGGEGGRDYERLCPSGWVAVGVTGRQGDYVESLSLLCADAKAGGFAPAATVETPPAEEPSRAAPPAERPSEPDEPSVETPRERAVPPVVPREPVVPPRVRPREPFVPRDPVVPPRQPPRERNAWPAPTPGTGPGDTSP